MPVAVTAVVAVVALLIGGGIGWLARGDGGGSSSATLETSTTTTTTKATTTSVSTSSTSTTTTAPPGPVEVMHVSGATKTNSDNFTVSGKWQITVNSTGTSAGVGVTIYGPGGNMVDGSTFPAGTSTSQERRTGTFYLEVTPFGGSYDIVVTDTPG